MRQIRMLRAMRRELETGLRPFLHGHEWGNPGHGQGVAYGLPRQFPTLPAIFEFLDDPFSPVPERQEVELLQQEVL